MTSISKCEWIVNHIVSSFLTVSSFKNIDYQEFFSFIKSPISIISF